MKRACLLLFFPLLVAQAQHAPDIKQAMEQTRADIAASVEELGVVRESIAARRAPLAAQMEQVEKEVASLRGEARRLRGLGNRNATSREAVERDLAGLNDELNFMTAALTEYRRAVEMQAGVAEVSGLKGSFRRIDQLLDRDDHAGLSEAGRELLELASVLRSGMEGGARFRGACLDAQGVERKGEFVILGPLSYFSAGQGQAAGMVSGSGGTMATLHPGTPEEAVPRIRALAAGEAVLVPVDLTGGDALKVVAARTSLIERMVGGGYTMIPLLIVAICATLISLWKFLSLTGVRTSAPGLIDELVRHLNAHDMEGAERAARRSRRPLSPILLAGIAYHDAPREHLEEIMHERMLAAIPSLDRHLGTLAVLGGIAPLLGLLGTVTGMIHTFQLVTLFGTGNASVLSGGISEALITTLAGLVIAIPVLLVHAILSRRVRTIIGHLEQTIVRFVNQLTIAREDA